MQLYGTAKDEAQADNDIRYDEHSLVWDLYFLRPANKVYALTDSEGGSFFITERLI